MSPFAAHHIVAVALGGALGSVTRYAIVVLMARWLGTGFPFGTIAVNFVGCTVMGILVELSALVWSPPPEVRSFALVGILGGLTTFSSFALDTGVLWERHSEISAFIYVAATLLLALGGFFTGMYVIRAMFAHAPLP